MGGTGISIDRRREYIMAYLPDGMKKLDDETVRVGNARSAIETACLFDGTIISYVKCVVGEFTQLIGYDPYYSNQAQVKRHDTIAAAFGIPRKLVALCRERFGDDKPDLFTFYAKAKDECDGDETVALNRTVSLFVGRLVKARHEFFVEKKHRDLCEVVIDDAWIEKNGTGLDAIEGLPSLTKSIGKED